MQSCRFCTIPKEVVEECSREIGIEKSSVHRILRAQKWKPYIPRLIHALNKDDPLATIQMVCRSVRRRRLECTMPEGGNFEHTWT